MNNISKSVLTLALCLGLGGAALAQSTEPQNPKTTQPSKAAKASKKAEKQNVAAVNGSGTQPVSKPHHESQAVGQSNKQDTSVKKPQSSKHEQAMHKAAPGAHEMKPVAKPSK